jgi:molybdopterin synthase catalytic subunit
MFLTRDPLDHGALVAQVASSRRGGIATFLGVVRDHQDGRAVQALEYFAYEPMAELVAAEIVSEAERRWPVTVALRHRLGRLTLGDVAVAIVAVGDHRDEAFAACRYVIEEVKRRVPIWKREKYADGTEAWVDPTRAREAVRG